MQTTANYALKKPENSDTVKIEDLNDNSDTIDAELKKRALQTDLTKTQEDFDTHKADNTAHGIGDKTKLNTTAKDTIVAAINEVFQSGTNVKSSTISAVNSKGQTLSTSATWDQIIAAISYIARGQGNAVESQVLSGVDFSNSDGILRHGSMPNNGTVVLTPTTVNQVIVQGYHPGTGYVKGDANLVTANIKSGVSIFGVSGKSSVVETTESANPIAASTVRSGKVGYVNGNKITGSLAVQATTAQTITPGTTDIVKGAGIYDGTITIKGDSNLQATNILKSKSIFGITGTVEEKQEFSTYLANLPETTYTPVSYIDGEGLYCYKTNSSDKTLYLFNSSGTIIKTIVNPSTHRTIYPFYVNDQYVLWGGYGLYYLDITDKNGTLLHEYSTSDQNSVMAACILNGQLYVFVGGYHLAQVRVYDMSFNEIRRTDCGVGGTMMWIYCFIPMKTGILIYGYGDKDFISFVTTEGVGKCIFNGTVHSDLTSFSQIFNTCFKLN